MKTSLPQSSPKSKRPVCPLFPGLSSPAAGQFLGHPSREIVSWLLLLAIGAAVGVDWLPSVVAQSAPQSPTDVEVLEQRLFDLPDVRFKRIKDVKGLPTYLLNIRQPIDHQNPSQGAFYQQVQLIHRGFDAPVVINTNGYTLETGRHELADILDANMVSVEHRFFGPSAPDKIDWKYLTIEQATADHHHVRELLGKLYSGDWISTGISKGGETCTYYRYFYPDDVVLSVPYVAPFPIGLKDERFFKFLDEKGSDACRKKIFDYQKAVLEHKAELVPRLKYYLKGKEATVDLIGGPEAALELFVLEFPFNFWQSGKDIDKVPSADADPEVLLDYLIDDGDYWYLLDKGTRKLAPHYYQHATQFGYYAYRTERFGDLIQKWKGHPSACFFPYDKGLTFDPTVRAQLTQWLQTKARNIVFLYGEHDTWTVAQAETGNNPNVRKFILAGKHHGTARIKKATPEERKAIMNAIRACLSKDHRSHSEQPSKTKASKTKASKTKASKTLGALLGSSECSPLTLLRHTEST